MGYLKHLFVAIALLTGLGGGLNLVIDPFDIFNMPRLERINTHKSIGPPPRHDCSGHVALPSRD